LGPIVICARCGYLELTGGLASPGGDPMRRAPPEPARARGRCPGCGERAWADPTLEATTLALRGAEDRLEPVYRTIDPARDTVRRAGIVGYALLVLAPLVWLAWLAHGIADGTVVVFILAATALGIGTRTVFALLRQRPRRAPRIAPMRWHLALPTATTMRDAAEGPVRARGPLLDAPLSGRSCVAYELGVRADGELDAPAHTWLLLEQRSVAFAVGSRTVPADAVRLELARERLELARFDAARVAELLRMRALAGNHQAWVVTESILVPGTTIALRSTMIAFGEVVCEMPCARPIPGCDDLTP
jgi:hypothetical protein